MRIMATLMRTDRPASDVMEILARQKEVFTAKIEKAGQEESCPCGSQLAYKDCHGWKPASRGRRRRRKSVSGPRPPVQASSQQL